MEANAFIFLNKNEKDPPCHNFLFSLSFFFLFFFLVYFLHEVLGILEPHYLVSLEVYLEANLNQDPNNHNLCAEHVVVVGDQG